MLNPSQEHKILSLLHQLPILVYTFYFSCTQLYCYSWNRKLFHASEILNVLIPLSGMPLSPCMPVNKTSIQPPERGKPCPSHWNFHNFPSCAPEHLTPALFKVLPSPPAKYYDTLGYEHFEGQDLLIHFSISSDLLLPISVIAPITSHWTPTPVTVCSLSGSITLLTRIKWCLCISNLQH